MENPSQNYNNFIKAVDTVVNDNGTVYGLTELENRERNQERINGIVTAAIYVLSGDEYRALTRYIKECGFNY